MIRQVWSRPRFEVVTPKEDLKAGKWLVSNEENLGDFTAVGYFFAQKLYAELEIPIGIINTSWGSTLWKPGQAVKLCKKVPSSRT